MPRCRVAAALLVPALWFVASPRIEAQDASAPAPLKFDWGVPSKVRVTEKATKAGRDAVTRYVISLTRSGSGGDVLLHLSEFEFVEIAGKSAGDPVLKDMVAHLLPFARAIPDILLSSDGRVKDVVGIEKAIDLAFADAEAAATEEGKAVLAKQRAQYATPEAKEAMKRNARVFWDAWVGDWAGLKVTEAEPVKTTHAMYLVDGTALDAPTTIRRSSEGGGVQLVRETALDAEQSQQALAAWLRRAAAATGHAPEGCTGLDDKETVTAVTDPATLKPVKVIRESRTVLHRKTAGDAETVERHEYTFDWSVK